MRYPVVAVLLLLSSIALSDRCPQPRPNIPGDQNARRSGKSESGA